MAPVNKPPHVPHDIWRTSNQQQKRWMVEDWQRGQSMERVAARVSHVRRKSVTEKGDGDER